MHKLLLRPAKADMFHHAWNKTRWRLYYMIDTKTKCLYKFNQFKFIFNKVNTQIINLPYFSSNAECHKCVSSTEQNTLLYTTLTLTQKGEHVSPFTHSPY
jgi:hypothetical protein